MAILYTLNFVFLKDCRPRNEEQRVPDIILPNPPPKTQKYDGREKWKNTAKPDQIRLYESGKGNFLICSGFFYLTNLD